MRPVFFLLAAQAPPPDEYITAAYGCFIWMEDDPYHSFAKPWVNPYGLRRDFPEREPLAGWYDDTQERFDSHLRAMDDAGLDVLVIDWYPDHVSDQHDARVNHGLRFCMNSAAGVSVRFCITLINHEPFAMKTDEDWETAIAQWLEAFKHPRYWRIDGKPVFTLHSNWHLEQHEGGIDQAAARIGLSPPTRTRSGVFPESSSAAVARSPGSARGSIRN